MLEDVGKPQNKIQEHIEQNKAQTLADEQGQLEERAKRKEQKEKKQEKVRKVMKNVGDTIGTTASVVSSIPHFATLAIGAGGGSLITSILKDWYDRENKKGK